MLSTFLLVPSFEKQNDESVLFLLRQSLLLIKGSMLQIGNKTGLKSCAY